MTTSAAQISCHMPALRAFAQSLTRDPSRADDLVQDTMERALTRFHLFQEGTNLRAWLFTMCRRIFLNDLRKSARRGTSLEYDESRFERPAPPTQEQKLHLNDVKAAFHQLPLKDKVILSLIAIEGLQYEEAANALDVPVGTVRSRLFRARARLDQIMEAGTLRPQDRAVAKDGFVAAA